MVNYLYDCDRASYTENMNSDQSIQPTANSFNVYEPAGHSCLFRACTFSVAVPFNPSQDVTSSLYPTSNT